MIVQLQGVANVLAQTTILQELFGAANAAAVLADNTFYGTAQDADDLPSNYVVYSLAEGSGHSVLSMAGDCVIKTPRVTMTFYVSDGTELIDSDSPQSWYIGGLFLYQELCAEILQSFVAGKAIYASDGTGRLSLTEIVFDEESIELSERSSGENYMTLTLTFILAPE